MKLIYGREIRGIGSLFGVPFHLPNGKFSKPLKWERDWYISISYLWGAISYKYVGSIYYWGWCSWWIVFQCFPISKIISTVISKRWLTSERGVTSKWCSWWWTWPTRYCREKCNNNNQMNWGPFTKFHNGLGDKSNISSSKVHGKGDISEEIRRNTANAWLPSKKLLVLLILKFNSLLTRPFSLPLDIYIDALSFQLYSLGWMIFEGQGLIAGMDTHANWMAEQA